MWGSGRAEMVVEAVIERVGLWVWLWVKLSRFDDDEGVSGGGGRGELGGEVMEVVKGAGWKGVNWMLYPFISRMSRYSRTSAT